MRFSRSSRLLLALTITAAATAVAAAVPAQAAHAAAAQLLPLTNPTFDQPYEGTDPRYLPVGVSINGAPIPGWTVTRGNVDIESAKWAKTGSLSQAMSLNGGEQGAIATTIPTSPHHRIDVTFRLGTETWDGCDMSLPERMAVTANSEDEVIFNAGKPDHVEPHWKMATYSFVAADRITHLAFESLVQGPCGAVLSDMTVEQE